jgi:hypothetical protein
MIVLAILNTVLVAMLQPVIDLMYPASDGKYHFIPKTRQILNISPGCNSFSPIMHKISWI